MQCPLGGASCVKVLPAGPSSSGSRASSQRTPPTCRNRERNGVCRPVDPASSWLGTRRTGRPPAPRINALPVVHAAACISNATIFAFASCRRKADGYQPEGKSRIFLWFCSGLVKGRPKYRGDAEMYVSYCWQSVPSKSSTQARISSTLRDICTVLLHDPDWGIG